MSKKINEKKEPVKGFDLDEYKQLAVNCGINRIYAARIMRTEKLTEKPMISGQKLLELYKKYYGD